MNRADFLGLKGNPVHGEQPAGDVESGLSHSGDTLKFGARHGDSVGQEIRPSSVCGNTTIAEAGVGESRPGGRGHPAFIARDRIGSKVADAAREMREFEARDPEGYARHIEEVRQRGYRLAGRNPDGTRK